jgi:hypothetical protein
MLRAIVGGRHGEGADVAYAAHVIASLGLPPDEAMAVASAAL